MSDPNPKPLNPGDLQILDPALHLNGKNYRIWVELIHTTLTFHRKLDHIEGGTPPTKDDPKFETWKQEDAVIMIWLWNSMNPEIRNSCIFSNSTSRKIWDFLHETYSTKLDMATYYTLKLKVSATTQGNLSVDEYYRNLKELWIELDDFHNGKMECEADAAILRSVVERDRIFEFLSGLNPWYHFVRLQIFCKEKLPSLHEVLSMVRHAESYQALDRKQGFKGTQRN